MSVYLNTAASEFHGVVQYTTLAVIQSMIIAAGKPVFAKLSDVLGRAAGLAISILCFTIGTVTIAASSSIGALAAGMVFFSCGNTGLSFSLSLLVADLTSPRWRCTISNMLTIHFIINFGIASKLTDALVPNNWRWGVSMFSIINPCVTGPMVAILAWQQYQSVKQGSVAKYPYQGMGAWTAFKRFLVDVDIAGLFCFTAGFLLLLLPLTIAQEAKKGYGTAYIIAMFVLGAALLLTWPVVEMYSPRPMVRLRRFFTNRDVIIPGAILFVEQFSVALTMTPAYQWITITRGWTPGEATYFLYTQSLCLVIFSIVAGFAATYTGRYRLLTIVGAGIRIIGLGLMIKYRGSGSSTFQVVMPQVLMGLGGGFMTANMLIVAQAAVSHEELSIVTGFILLVLELGAAIGSAVVGAVQQTLRSSLHQYMDPVTGGNATIVNMVYAQGSLAASHYPLGSPVRDAIVHAWTDNIHQLVVAAITLGAVNFLICAALPDHELKDNQHNNIDSGKAGILPPTASRLEDI